MLFAFALVLLLLGQHDSCFVNIVEEELGACVPNAIFAVGPCVSLIVVLNVACNGFIIVDNDGRDSEVGGLFFDFMEGDDVNDVDGFFLQRRILDLGHRILDMGSRI